MTNDPLIEFIRGYREPTDIKFIGQELERLGRLGCDWPRASASQWMIQIRGYVSDGKLMERDGVISIPKVQRVVQGNLFD